MEKYVLDALEHANGELNGADVLAALLAQRMYLLTVQCPRICGAVTCEVVEYPRKRAIRVVTLGGENFGDWSHALNAELLAWCQRIDAQGIECFVRRGLVPQLVALGYEHTYTGMWLNGQEQREDADS